MIVLLIINSALFGGSVIGDLCSGKIKLGDAGSSCSIILTHNGLSATAMLRDIAVAPGHDHHQDSSSSFSSSSSSSSSTFSKEVVLFSVDCEGYRDLKTGPSG